MHSSTSMDKTAVMEWVVIHQDNKKEDEALIPSSSLGRLFAALTYVLYLTV